MYFMLILVSGAKMQLPPQLGVTETMDRLTDSTTTVTLCACALRVNYKCPQDDHVTLIGKGSING